MFRTKILFGLAASIVAVGCSSAVPTELADARDAYKQASSGAAEQYDPASLHKARRSLELAEKTYDVEGDSTGTRDRAYVAKRQAQLATVRGRTVHNETTIASLEKSKEANQLQELASQEQLLAKQRAEIEAMAKLSDGQSQEQGQPTQRQVITLSGSVLFATGESELFGPAKERLSAVAEALPKSADILVKGHTDNRGSRELNDRLSKRRAESVADYLVEQGVPRSNVEARGMGFSEPVASNRTADGRANNRRVEIVVEQQPGALSGEQSLDKPEPSK